MSKPIELIYSQQSSDFIEGRAYSNPRFFTTPRANVSKVYLVGDWPNIRAAYENMGVPVEQLGAPPAPPPPPQNIPGPAEDPATVVIPENWSDLLWSRPDIDGGLTLRGLASSVSPTPVLNKAMAKAAIEAELARRGATVDPLDVPQPEALGLTLRELHSDLTAMGVQWDNEGPAELLRMRDKARALNEAG